MCTLSSEVALGAVEFAATVIDSVIWPLTVFALLLVFRSPIDKILTQLSKRINVTKSLRGPGGLGMTFDAGVLEAREQARAIPGGDPHVQRQESGPVTTHEPYGSYGIDLGGIDDFDVEVLATRADQDPRALVLDSWLHLEDSLHNLAQAIDIDRPERIPSLRLLGMLAKQARSRRLADAIPAIEQLNQLRNQVLHDRRVAISPLAAHDYALTAVRLALVVKEEGQR
jgi:hypothetical protein